MPAVMVLRADKTLTTNIEEMDVIIHQGWDPILHQHVDLGNPEPKVQPFLDEYGKYIQ